LIQKKPHLIAAPEHVFRAHLGRERGALGVERLARAVLLGAKLAALVLSGLNRRIETLEPPALLGDAEIRLSQARAERIALLELGTQPAGQVRNTLADRGELGLRLGGIGLGRGAPPQSGRPRTAAPREGTSRARLAGASV